MYLSVNKISVINQYGIFMYSNQNLPSLINPLVCFLNTKGHAALDRNPGLGYNTLLLRLIPEDIYYACLHRQFHPLPGFLHSQTA